MAEYLAEMFLMQVKKKTNHTAINEAQELEQDWYNFKPVLSRKMKVTLELSYF